MEEEQSAEPPAELLAICPEIACEFRGSLLASVDCFACELNVASLQALIDVLPPSVSALGLASNALGARGVMPVLEMLRQNESAVTNLNMANNGLLAPGAFAVASALRGNNVLERLNLVGNNIGPAGVQLLVQLFDLDSRTAVSALNIGSNAAGDIGEWPCAERPSQSD
jgi:hypothetical protein